MLQSDAGFIVIWWFTFFIIGTVFLPFTTLLFSHFFDKGYVFSKIVGSIFLSYVLLLGGALHILPFSWLSIIALLALFAVVSNKYLPNAFFLLKKHWKIFLFEEVLFLLTLSFWSYIRGHQPNINGLEKFMDYGFVISILHTTFFPPKDMWLTPFSINYYYFGHLITAVITKLSTIPSEVSYNLMLATLFAGAFTLSFSLGANIYNIYLQSAYPQKLKSKFWKRSVLAGFLAGLLVAGSGNLHTLYTFFKPYPNDQPAPLTNLSFNLENFPNNYWYPNATRFIYNTIHEFPSYSFIVSDLHGHVLSIPIVLSIVAIIAHEFVFFRSIRKWILILLSFLVAIAYTTNALDGPIYLLLTILVLLVINSKNITWKLFSFRNVTAFNFNSFIQSSVLLFVGFILFQLPFSWFFKPFVSGIGVLCAPQFLINIGNIGPFLFEANHCQKSPIWQLIILYGFFYFWVLIYLFFLIRQKVKTYADYFIIILIVLSTLLIIIPEFVYIKDIYPAHYRANTMFKLVYQAFILLSLCSAFIFFRIFTIKKSVLKFGILIVGIIGIFLVVMYPYFGIDSYYGKLKNYQGLNGISYLKNIYPNDYEAIVWMKQNIQNQPVILEAQGDSYTDFGRVSSYTGFPTVLGWTVHEWLWRGNYDIDNPQTLDSTKIYDAPAPRINEVQTLYETEDLIETKRLLQKYKISYVFVGELERQKYKDLFEKKFELLGKSVYKSSLTKIYKIN